jgi:hypothetical protein
VAARFGALRVGIAAGWPPQLNEFFDFGMAHRPG